MQADRALTFTKSELFWCAFLYLTWEASERQIALANKILMDGFMNCLHLTEQESVFLRQGVRR